MMSVRLLVWFGTFLNSRLNRLERQCHRLTVGAHPILMRTIAGIDEMLAEILSRSNSPRLTPAELAL